MVLQTAKVILKPASLFGPHCQYAYRSYDGFVLFPTHVAASISGVCRAISCRKNPRVAGPM